MSRPRTPRRLRRQRFVAHLVAMALLLLLTAPFLWLLQMSIKSNDDIFAMPPKLVFQPTGEHYLAVWKSDFPRSFWNSTLVSVGTTVLRSPEPPSLLSFVLDSPPDSPLSLPLFLMPSACSCSCAATSH